MISVPPLSFEPDSSSTIETFKPGLRQPRAAIGYAWRSVLTPTSLAALLVLACGGSATPANAADDGAATADGETPPPCASLDVCEQQCDADAAQSCEWAGRMYETGEGAPQDYAQAAKLYDRACSGGREEACAHLAMMYDIGLAVEEDPERANELYRKACESGNRWACKRSQQLDE